VIDRSIEEQVLQYALRQGYLTQQEIDDHAREARWGPLLTPILYSGLLSEALAERLLDQVAEGAEGETQREAGAEPAGGAAFTPQERYQIGDLIGHGGMGTVYRAYDRSLKRAVALKFLRSEDPALVERFLREAQVQAQIDHEHVCRVYDVGVLDGRAYIAMQLVEGEPLDVASPTLERLSIEQKVRILQQVAEGIHAAHRAELIHRDLKPSNIMLERAEDGKLKPCVLDFGLARAREATAGSAAAGASLGLVAGTPNFMAPEQARGESAVLDRRTDVYGLGATLYALLAGRPPFEGEGSEDVLRKVVHDEAPRLTSVPEDVATIVAKCLDKQPSRRYESARALAEDLGRYLDGEPIHARNASLSYRLLKKARKHRKLVAAAALATAAFVTLATMSVRAQLRAREQARLAGVFGQEVKTIESLLRIAQLAPEHDVRKEKAAIRVRMAALEAQVERLGDVALGPGHYALGRGHLALREYDLARKDLEQAWNAGYREREVAYALGQVMGVFYQRALEAARRITDPAQREAKVKQAEHDFRDPALAYLQQSRGLAVDSPEYVEALLAFYEQRYPDALKKAREAYARLPWLHEARGLEARILDVIGDDEGTRGQVDEAMEHFAQAEAAYHAAMDVGRSDETLPEGLCRVFGSAVTLDLYGAKPRPLEPHYEKGRAACEHALRIDPADVRAMNALGGLYGRMAEIQAREDKDPREMLKRRIEVGRRIVALQPDNADAYNLIAFGLVRTVNWDESHGGDGAPMLREAIAALDKAIALDPNSSILNGQGMNYQQLGDNAARRGRDPRPAWRKADEFFRKATEMPPGYMEYNVTGVYSGEADWDLDHGLDPRELLERARELGAKGTAIDPTNSMNLAMMAFVYALHARAELALDGNPEPALEPLVAQAKATLARNAKDADALEQMATVQWVLANLALKEGRSPEAAVREGLEWAASARRVKPDSALGIEARLALASARWRVFHGLSPAEPLARAERAIAAILRTYPDEPFPNALSMEALWLRARSQRGPTAAPLLARGLAVADKLLAVDPRSARVLALRGALRLEQAGGDRAQVARARESLEQALEVNRFLSWEFGMLVEQARKAAPAN
jgi:serine/threonine-protein kinase